jgi:hypothetical protein
MEHETAVTRLLRAQDLLEYALKAGQRRRAAVMGRAIEHLKPEADALRAQWRRNAIQEQLREAMESLKPYRA